MPARCAAASAASQQKLHNGNYQKNLVVIKLQHHAVEIISTSLIDPGLCKGPFNLHFELFVCSVTRHTLTMVNYLHHAVTMDDPCLATLLELLL